MSVEAALSLSRPRAPRVRVRWRIFLFTFAFGLIAYLQQKGPTIAGYRMMPVLGLTQMQLGWLETAFLVGYAALQFPSSVIGQRIGARRLFAYAGLISIAATLVTPLAPFALHGAVLFTVLVAAQLLLGASQAPIFPVSTGLYEPWFPTVRWSLVNGLQAMCLGLGIAVTAPLMAGLMLTLGWQLALLATVLPALIVIPWWAWYGRTRASRGWNWLSSARPVRLPNTRSPGRDCAPCSRTATCCCSPSPTWG